MRRFQVTLRHQTFPPCRLRDGRSFASPMQVLEVGKPVLFVHRPGDDSALEIVEVDVPELAASAMPSPPVLSPSPAPSKSTQPWRRGRRG